MQNYRRKPNLKTETVGDGLAVLDTGQNKPYVLNATSALVFQQCDGETTLEQIIEVVRKQLNVPIRQARQLTWLSLAELDKHELIEAGFVPTHPPQRVVSRRDAMSLLSAAGLSMALLPFIIPVAAHANVPSEEWTTTTSTEEWTTTTTTEEWTTTTTTEEWTTTTTTEEWTTTTTTEEEWTTTTTTEEEWTTTTTTEEEWTTTTTTEEEWTTTTTTSATFNFTGWFSPVDNPFIVNSVKAGQSVPMKFSLAGYQGMDVIESGYPVSQQIQGVDWVPVNEVQGTNSQSGLSYDAGSDRYNYVWKTNAAWAGTWRKFTMRLTDGTDHFALFKFK